MATAKDWLQDVITCDLCVNPTQQFCNSCQVSLCKDCVRKHTDEFKTVSHEIAPFLDRKIQLALPECQEHSGQRCEVNCKDCNTPVCVKCILTGPHIGHNAEELTDAHERKKQEVEADTQKLKSEIIPKYQKVDADIRVTKSKTETNFDALGNECKNLRQLWHREVDNIFDKIDLLVQSRREGNMDEFKGYEAKIKNLISEMNKTLEQKEKILQSYKFSEVNKYLSKIKEFQDFSEEMDIKMPSFNTNIDHDNELSIEIGGYQATLKHKSQPNLSADVSRLTTRTGDIIDRVRVIATIPTSYKPLFGIACVGEAEAWIHGTEETVTRIDIQGSVKDRVVTTCPLRPDDISVTRKGELIYSDSHNGHVNIVRQGKSEIHIIKPRWGLLSLIMKEVCCTGSGDVLVHILERRIPFVNQIVRFQGQNITQQINWGKSNSIFVRESGTLRINWGNSKSIIVRESGTLWIAENNTGDICISDSNIQAVAVLDKSGTVRFRYDGTPADRKTPFDPRCIVTDDFGQIIVADYNNNCLHILDQNGKFMRCIDDCELEKPYGLSVDNEGRLWVGLHESGTIKVIEYI